MERAFEQAVSERPLERAVQGQPVQAANLIADTPPEHSTTSIGQKRINVIFSAQQYDLLRDLAKKRGVNVSDILRQAINIMKLVVDANQDGKILIERKGKVQQLKLV
jgi:hypothetical protein